MRIVIAGSSGMIGTALRAALAERGDALVRLVRRPAAAADEAEWDPAHDVLDASVFDGADAVVNLAGASLNKLPWTSRYREQILWSRVDATWTLVRALGEASAQGFAPRALLSGSAVGFYGSRPRAVLSEASARGIGFLANVVSQWETEASAVPSGTRVALLRTGVVIGPGGAVAPLRLLARAGLAGPLGGGRQVWPWISLRDEVRAILHVLDNALSGPVNLVGPSAATAGELGRALAASLHRPYWLPAPAFAISGLLGDAGRELLLSDQHVVPAVLQKSGFRFLDETVQSAVAAL